MSDIASMHAPNESAEAAAIHEPVVIERYQRRWRFIPVDMPEGIAPRWMWEGPDGPVDARAYSPIEPRTQLVEALNFWVHDWAFFRAIRHFEHDGREWTARRSSRGTPRPPMPGEVRAKSDVPGMHFRASNGRALFLPLELDGPEFVTMGRDRLCDYLETALDTL